MAKYKALMNFKGKKENKVFKKDEEFDMTVKRADEIQKNVKDNYDVDDVMERLDNKDEEK